MYMSSTYHLSIHLSLLSNLLLLTEIPEITDIMILHPQIPQFESPNKDTLLQAQCLHDASPLRVWYLGKNEALAREYQQDEKRETWFNESFRQESHSETS